MSVTPAAGSAGTWDGHAGRYPRQERLETRAVAAALRLADPGPHDRLVDLATGTGLLLRVLATRPRRPATAIGVDRSERMLAQTGRLPDGWRTLLGDARNTPLAAGDADVVTCCYLLHLQDAEDRRRVLDEARRLLRPAPASRLVTVTVWTSATPPGGRALGALLRGLARARPRALGGLMPLDPTSDLHAAGLVVTHRLVLPRGGYPSLILRARPA